MKKVFVLTDEEDNVIGVVSDMLYKSEQELVDDIVRLDDKDLALFVDVDSYKLYDNVEEIMYRLKLNALKYSDTEDK